jgi:hypothetical protein
MKTCLVWLKSGILQEDLIVFFLPTPLSRHKKTVFELNAIKLLG